MKKTVVTGLVCFVCGVLLPFPLVLWRMLPDKSAIEYVRIEKRIVYEPDGRIKEAYLSFPSFEEYYDAISKESGFTILTEDLPRMSNSHTLTNTTWLSVIEHALPLPIGFEAVLVAPKTYKIRRKKTA